MSDSGKDGASKSSNDDVCDVNDMLQNMNTDDEVGNDVSVISVCAHCGKEGTNLKSCTACKMVKYCNRECQIAHRPRHKKECRKRAAELHDEELFKQPPPKEDCPICMERLPTIAIGRTYMVCCGKEVCSGCSYAPVYDNQGNIVDNRNCAFCRTPPPLRDRLERYNTRLNMNDTQAICNLACYYNQGRYGLQRDHAKALELWQRAGELGSADAYCNIASAYMLGDGVEVDEKKASYYWELSAMRGQIEARHNLGVNEGNAGNTERALKHFMIAVKDGSSYSLESIKRLYQNGDVTKEDYAKALQLYQEYLGEIKSPQRDEAAAADDGYRYY